MNDSSDALWVISHITETKCQRYSDLHMVSPKNRRLRFLVITFRHTGAAGIDRIPRKINRGRGRSPGLVPLTDLQSSFRLFSQPSWNVLRRFGYRVSRCLRPLSTNTRLSSLFRTSSLLRSLCSKLAIVSLNPNNWKGKVNCAAFCPDERRVSRTYVWVCFLLR